MINPRIITIFETPINDFERIGNWNKEESFNKLDVRLLKNQTHIKKIHDAFNKTEFKFNIYLINHPEMIRLQNKYIGEFSIEELNNLLPPSILSELKTFAKNKGRGELPFEKNAINILFNGNYGDNLIPVTPWIIAHRISHTIGDDDSHNIMAVVLKYFNEILKKGYLYDNISLLKNTPKDSYGLLFRFSKIKPILMSFFYEVGKFRSARQKNLSNHIEFGHELFAQYIITGKITFNDLPKSIIVEKFGINPEKTYTVKDEQTYKYCKNLLNISAKETEHSIHQILTEATGKIFMV